MTTLAEFLLARIAEDEEVAREAVDLYNTSPDGRWVFVEYPYEGSWPVSPDDDGVSSQRSDDNWQTHATRHDPARVLAECEAKRRIVELHEGWPVLIQTEPRIEAAPDLGNFAYRASQEIAWATNREYVARFGTEPPTTPMLLALAAVYADHADYDEAWRP